MSLRYCPAGRHPMDPGWDVCPYCASESAKGPARKGDATYRSTDESSRESALSSGSVPASDPGRTVFGGAADSSRRLVGVLATWTWRPEGELFPIREGSNLLGSSPICEARISTDPQMSGRHASIVYRPGGFWIDDENSMNGTFVDGEPVEEKQRLPATALIRTGDTVWRFTAFEPPPDRLNEADGTRTEVP